MINHIKITKAKWGVKLLPWVYTQKILRKLGIYEDSRIIIEDNNYSELLNHGYLIKNQQKESYKVQLPYNNKEILLRRFSSDYDVFNQIIINDEYGKLIKIVKERNISIKTIMDAGANIGLASLIFHDNFPDSKIYCIEPDSNNNKILRQNTISNKLQVDIINKALWSKNTKLYLNKNFRDGREWAVSVSEKPVGEEFIDSITIQEVMEKNNIEKLDLIKLDIEGSEFEIFCGKNANMSFLKDTKVIAIEIHEEFGSKNRIIDILKEFDFSIMESGEYTVAIKD